jgi:hypothetical protein
MAGSSGLGLARFFFFDGLLSALSARAMPFHRLVRYALLISLSVILVRILWVFPVSYLPVLHVNKSSILTGNSRTRMPVAW